MAKKSAPAEEALPEPTEEDIAAAPIEVPADVVEALGGMPIPPPPGRMPRPTVTRVGEPLAKSRPDPGGLLASPRPERREALKKLDEARAALSRFVRLVEDGLPETGAKIAAAARNTEVCEAEGFDPARAKALVDDFAAALAKHLG
jgi:hypothetical protein